MTALIKSAIAGAALAALSTFGSVAALTAAPEDNPANQHAIEYGE